MSEFDRRAGAERAAEDAELFAWLDRLWRPTSTATDAFAEPTPEERENFARWLDREFDAVQQLRMAEMPFYARVIVPTHDRERGQGVEWLAELEQPPASAPGPTAEETSAFARWVDDRIGEATAASAGDSTRGPELDYSVEPRDAASAENGPTPAETAHFERWLDAQVSAAATNGATSPSAALAAHARSLHVGGDQLDRIAASVPPPPVERTAPPQPIVIDRFAEGARRDSRRPQRRRIWLSTAAALAGVAVLVAAFMASQNLRHAPIERLNPWAAPELEPPLATLHVRPPTPTMELEAMVADLRPFEILAFEVVGVGEFEFDVYVSADRIAALVAWAATRGAQVEPADADLQRPGRYRVRVSSSPSDPAAG